MDIPEGDDENGFTNVGSNTIESTNDNPPNNNHLNHTNYPLRNGNDEEESRQPEDKRQISRPNTIQIHRIHNDTNPNDIKLEIESHPKAHGININETNKTGMGLSPNQLNNHHHSIHSDHGVNANSYQIQNGHGQGHGHERNNNLPSGQIEEISPIQHHKSYSTSKSGNNRRKKYKPSSKHGSRKSSKHNSRQNSEDIGATKHSIDDDENYYDNDGNGRYSKRKRNESRSISQNQHYPDSASPQSQQNSLPHNQPPTKIKSKSKSKSNRKKRRDRAAQKGHVQVPSNLATEMEMAKFIPMGMGGMSQKSADSALEASSSDDTDDEKSKLVNNDSSHKNSHDRMNGNGKYRRTDYESPSGSRPHKFSDYEIYFFPYFECKDAMRMAVSYLFVTMGCFQIIPTTDIAYICYI